MAYLYVYALLTALLFTCLAADEGKGKTHEDLLRMIQTLQNEMATLESNEKNAQDEIATLKSNEQKAQERTEALESETKQLRENNRALTDKIEKLIADKDFLESWINGRQMDAESMFLATMSEYSVPIVDGDPIIWNSAPINPGGHFNTILGMYTAPVNGYYQFSVNKEGDNFSGGFYILVDEVRYAYKDAYHGSNVAPAGSATINVELTAGQIVRVQNYGSSTVYGINSGFMHSWFTGHLLYAL